MTRAVGGMGRRSRLKNGARRLLVVGRAAVCGFESHTAHPGGRENTPRPSPHSSGAVRRIGGKRWQLTPGERVLIALVPGYAIWIRRPLRILRYRLGDRREAWQRWPYRLWRSPIKRARA